MAFTGKWLGAFLSRIRDPKNRRRVISVVGATVILGTFLVKDVKRDNLKDLVGSIDAAENTYLVRKENRRNYDEVKRFEREFAEFREHPTTPRTSSQFGGGSSSSSYSYAADGEVDWESFNATDAEQTANNELLDNVVRLGEKVSRGPGKKDIEDNYAKNQMFSAEMRDIWVLGWDLQRSGKEHVKEIKDLNRRIYDQAHKIDEISDATDKLNLTILQTAENERKKDEFWFFVWTWIFYGLYLVGWTIGVAGVLMGDGGDKKDDVVEEITDIIA